MSNFKELPGDGAIRFSDYKGNDGSFQMTQKQVEAWNRQRQGFDAIARKQKADETAETLLEFLRLAAANANYEEFRFNDKVKMAPHEVDKEFERLGIKNPEDAQRRYMQLKYGTDATPEEIAQQADIEKKTGGKPSVHIKNDETGRSEVVTDHEEFEKRLKKLRGQNNG